MLDKAIRIAAQAFEGKFDKGGNPYILHCLHVMNDTNSSVPEVRVAAVLHDLIEDTDWTYEKLLAEGFSMYSIDLIKVLTHDKVVTYDDYIKRISFDKNATLIKMADLRHNSDITRLKDVRKKDFDRLQKYSLAYRYLSGL